MSKVANILYKPVGLAGGVVAGILATSLVNKIWALVSGDPSGPPAARTRGERWQKVVAGAAMQGAVFAAVKTAIDRAGARQFERWSGEYPGT
jgi:hypothetical protein